MNLFQVKQAQTVKIIELKKGNHYPDNNAFKIISGWIYHQLEII